MSTETQDIKWGDFVKAGGDPSKLPAVQSAIKAVEEQADGVSTGEYMAEAKTVNGVTLFYPTLAHRWMIDSVILCGGDIATKAAQILYVLSFNSEDVFGPLGETFDSGRMKGAARRFVAETLKMDYAEGVKLANKMLVSGMGNIPEATDGDSKKKTPIGGRR